MNYRHAFHAGNFADVFKHAVLARIIVHLREKEQPFRVIDTHAGTGAYDLSAEEATRTGEWRDGIGRVMATNFTPEIRLLLAPYLDAVAALNGGRELRRYPGSPLIALALMRPQDRLVACELEPRASVALARQFGRDRRARAVRVDGWVALKAYVPPKERRGAVLVDPPFEDKQEFVRLADAVRAAHRKWATGTYLLWYPIKDRIGPDELASRLGGIAKALRVEIGTGEPGRLNGAGLIVINPPWRLPDELARLMPVLGPLLRPGAKAAAIDWLARES
jgi:23S rRNA (adenine2030-N6)-methyltransferase